MNGGRTTDLLVIGGGVIGLSVAYEVARRGRSVMVVEKERPGSGATDVAAGMLAPIAEADASLPQIVQLGLDSVRRYPEMVARIEQDSGLDCDYVRSGTVMVALDADHREVLRHLAGERERMGLEVRELSAGEARELEPRLSPRVVGGLQLMDDHSVDPRRLARALAAAIERRGGSLVFPAQVTAIDREGPSVAVKGASGQILQVRAGAVLVAAGSWTSRDIPGFDHLPLRPVKGQVVRVRGEKLIERVVRTPDVYLVPRSDGELVVGASSEEKGFDDRQLIGPILRLLTDAWRALPEIRELELFETNVGFRPTLRDHLPAIGPSGVEGVYLATGHYRHGILLAAATAELLAGLIVDGDSPELLQAFDPRRFAPAADRAS